MKTDSIEVSTELPVPPAVLFDAWLDAEAHTALSGGEASSEPVAGGAFTAWDGYITGHHLEIEPPRRIVQAWRTSEFPEDAPDSRLELIFEPVEGGTRLLLRHEQIPAGQGERYRQGWQDFYFTPMKRWSESAG